MNKPTQPRRSDNLRRIRQTRGGVRHPEELAEFLRRNVISADDLIAFGYILTTRIHRSEGHVYIPKAAFAKHEGSPEHDLDLGPEFLHAALIEASGASEAWLSPEYWRAHTREGARSGRICSWDPLVLQDSKN
jgi:hypothetical protein